jgi:hypothetical protein
MYTRTINDGYTLMLKMQQSSPRKNMHVPSIMKYFNVQNVMITKTSCRLVISELPPPTTTTTTTIRQPREPCANVDTRPVSHLSVVPILQLSLMISIPTTCKRRLKLTPGFHLINKGGKKIKNKKKNTAKLLSILQNTR